MNRQLYSAGLIIIGDELLSAKVKDQNSPFLISRLAKRGIEVREMRVLPDVQDIVAEAVLVMSKRWQFIFTTGGVGPTHDDITIAAIAQAFGVKVVRDDAIAREIKKYYRGRADEGVLRMANVPDGAQVLTDGPKLAPAIAYDNIFIFPGVPALMQRCYEHIVEKLPRADMFRARLYLNVQESEVTLPLDDLNQRHPNVAIGSYPRFDDTDHKLQITFDGRNETAVTEAIDDTKKVFLEYFVREDSTVAVHEHVYR